MGRFFRKHTRLAVTLSVLAIIALVLAIPAAQYKRPIPDLSLAAAPAQAPDVPAAPDIAWPPVGQASVAIQGVGLLGESPHQDSGPIASLVKIMTAYVILKNHPLNRGDPGPDVEIQDHNVDDYYARLANGESVVPIPSGTKVNERQLLRGMLLASGNNLANVLAEWHSGSIDAFVAEMNKEAKDLGMTQTRYTDAAGVMPTSISSAHDQLILATAAMANPAFAMTVNEPQAAIPGAGVVFNTNSQLGNSGIVGIKTGWTEEAGACFVFASQTTIGDRPVTIIGAVLGQDTLNDAFARTKALINTAKANVKVVNFGAAGQPVAQIKSKWGETADAVLASDASVFVLPGMDVQTHLQINPATTVRKDQEVGSVSFVAGGQTTKVPLKAAGPVGKPDLQWRLTRLQ